MRSDFVVFCSVVLSVTRVVAVTCPVARTPCCDPGDLQVCLPALVTRHAAEDCSRHVVYTAGAVKATQARFSGVLLWWEVPMEGSELAVTSIVFGDLLLPRPAHASTVHEIPRARKHSSHTACSLLAFVHAARQCGCSVEKSCDAHSKCLFTAGAGVSAR